jgi:4-amino-4-deoxy-L-arabinose transferase-like glycosyltransferase
MAGSVMECGTDWRPLSTVPRSRSGTPHRFANVATVVELACITVLALSGYLLGAGQYDLLTDDEIRYAEAGRQMLRTGDWIVPVYNGEPRYQKPLLVYWLQAIGQGLFGNHALAARIPSALAAAMTLLSTWSIARTVWDASTARWTVLVLGTMVEFVLLARMVLIDMLLVACLQASVAAMLSAWHAKSVLARSFRYQWAGLALGLAVCAKGPLAVLLFVLFALPLVMVMRRMRRRGGDSCGEPRQSARLDERLLLSERCVVNSPMVSATSGNNAAQFPHLGCFWDRRDLLLLLPAGLIALLVGLGSYLLPHWRTGGEFTWQFLIAENWQRFTSVINEHPQPIWFYLALLVPLSFPWTGAIPFALCHAWQGERHNGCEATDDGIATCDLGAAWSRAALIHIGLVFAFFTFSRTKVWTYTFPAMPSLALLIARWLVCQLRVQPQQLRRYLNLALGVGVLICASAAIVVTAWPDRRLPEEVQDEAFLFAVRSWAWFLVGILSLCWWLSRFACSVRLALAALVLGTVAWYSVAVYYVLPTADRMWNGPVRLVAGLWQQCPEAEVFTYHVHELGLNFHARRDLVHHWRKEALPDLYERLRHPRPAIVLVDTKLLHHLRGLPTHVWDRNRRFVVLANFERPSFPQIQADQFAVIAHEEPTVRHSR